METNRRTNYTLEHALERDKDITEEKLKYKTVKALTDMTLPIKLIKLSGQRQSSCEDRCQRR